MSPPRGDSYPREKKGLSILSRLNLNLSQLSQPSPYLCACAYTFRHRLQPVCKSINIGIWSGQSGQGSDSAVSGLETTFFQGPSVPPWVGHGWDTGGTVAFLTVSAAIGAQFYAAESDFLILF